MSVASPLARAALALAAALALPACGGTVDLTLERDLELSTAVDGGTVLVPIDLAADAGRAWSHRDRISDVSIRVAEATIAEVRTPPNTATAVSGAVWLLPEGAAAPGAGAVRVGTFTDEPVAVGHTVALQPSPELDAFLLDAFRGTGRFGVYAVGTAAGGAVVAVRLHVVLGLSLKWRDP